MKTEALAKYLPKPPEDFNIPMIVKIGWKAVRDFTSLRKDMKKADLAKP